MSTGAGDVDEDDVDKCGVSFGEFAASDMSSLQVFPTLTVTRGDFSGAAISARHRSMHS
jgi:hypothetical protein